jgi:hypothetical protein
MDRRRDGGGGADLHLAERGGSLGESVEERMSTAMLVENVPSTTIPNHRDDEARFGTSSLQHAFQRGSVGSPETARTD